MKENLILFLKTCPLEKKILSHFHQQPRSIAPKTHTHTHIYIYMFIFAFK